MKPNIFEPADFEQGDSPGFYPKEARLAAKLANRKLASLGIEASSLLDCEREVWFRGGVIDALRESLAELEHAYSLLLVSKQEVEHMLAAAPVVVSEMFHGPWWENAASKKDTYRARIVQIEEIKK